MTIEMVNYTRLDCVNGAAALMRQALAQAMHHATYRQAFGRALIDQPLMRNVLADLAIESEAATTLLLRLASAADRADGDEHEARFKRLGTAVAKYWVCKRAPTVTAEVLECLGGNGYLCRGEHHATPLSGVAAQLNLGRLRQRQLPGCLARNGERAIGGGGIL